MLLITFFIIGIKSKTSVGAEVACGCTTCVFGAWGGGGGGTLWCGYNGYPVTVRFLTDGYPVTKCPTPSTPSFFLHSYE